MARRRDDEEEFSSLESVPHLGRRIGHTPTLVRGTKVRNLLGDHNDGRLRSKLHRHGRHQSMINRRRMRVRSRG